MKKKLVKTNYKKKYFQDKINPFQVDYPLSKLSFLTHTFIVYACVPCTWIIDSCAVSKYTAQAGYSHMHTSFLRCFEQLRRERVK